MPINYSKYPPNWKEIRTRILQRSENRCECCGLENKITVLSYKKDGKTIWERGTFESWLKNGLPKRVKVVLTIAHLDHDETNHNVTDDRLKAMCQLCRLRYDAEEKSKRRLAKQ